MAKFFDEEVLAVNATTSVRLTSTKYDHNGSSRASKASIQVGTTPIWFNFSVAVPAAVPIVTKAFIANVGDIVEITDFDNMRNVQIISQSGSGSVYVAYES